MKVTQKSNVNEFLDAGNPEEEADSAPEIAEGEPLSPLDIIAQQFPDAPPRQVLEGWKDSYGDVYAFVPDATSLFLLRPLRRLEHKNVSRDIRAFADGPTGREDPSLVEEQMHERVVGTCMLYPSMSPTFLTMSRAGLMPTLFNLVMEHSKFLSPERALNSCFKL